MSPEQLQFVNTLFARSSTDMSGVALDLRLCWQRLDHDTLQAVGAWAIAEAGYNAAQESADLAARTIGLGPQARDSHAEQVKGFAQIVFAVARSNGDPPFPPRFHAMALQVALGRVAMPQAMRALASGHPQGEGAVAALEVLLPLQPVILAALAQTVQVMGVLAMPRVQLYDYVTTRFRDPVQGSHEACRRALAECQARMRRGETSVAHDLALEALHLAARTPDTVDDLKVIEAMAILPPNTFSAAELEEVTQQLVGATASADGTSPRRAVAATRAAARTRADRATVLPRLAGAATAALKDNVEAANWHDAAFEGEPLPAQPPPTAAQWWATVSPARRSVLLLVAVVVLIALFLLLSQ